MKIRVFTYLAMDEQGTGDSLGFLCLNSFFSLFFHLPLLTHSPADLEGEEEQEIWKEKILEGEEELEQARSRRTDSSPALDPVDFMSKFRHRTFPPANPL